MATKNQRRKVMVLLFAAVASQSAISGEAYARSTSAQASSEVVNVLLYGADPKGVSDSTRAIRNAIEHGCAIATHTLPAEIFFPAGTYKVSNQTVNDPGAIIIPCNYLNIRGAGIGNTLISRLTVGDTNPDATCPLATDPAAVRLADGPVNRGAIFFVTAGNESKPHTPRYDVGFYNLSATGNRTTWTNTKTGKNSWPAMPPVRTDGVVTSSDLSKLALDGTIYSSINFLDDRYVGQTISITGSDGATYARTVSDVSNNGAASIIKLSSALPGGAAGKHLTWIAPMAAACGNVWDVSEKAIFVRQDHDSYNITLQNVETEYISGEHLYGGSTQSYGYLIGNYHCHNGNGDCVSISAGLKMTHSKVEHFVANGIENNVDGPIESQDIDGNSFDDILLDAIGIPITFTTQPSSEIKIHGNTVTNTRRNGIFVSGGHGAIYDNHLTDTGAGNGCGISLYAFKGMTVSHVVVANNTVEADKKSLNSGICSTGDIGPSSSNLDIENNTTGVTAYGQTHGSSMSSGVSMGMDGANVNLVENNNKQIGTIYGSWDHSSVIHKRLDFAGISRFSGNPIALRRPVAGHPRRYSVKLHVTVTATTTGVHGSFNWNEPSGKTNTIQIMAKGATTLQAGEYDFASGDLLATGTTESDQIAVYLDADTPANIYVTVHIDEAGSI